MKTHWRLVLLVAVVAVVFGAGGGYLGDWVRGEEKAAAPPTIQKSSGSTFQSAPANDYRSGLSPLPLSGQANARSGILGGSSIQRSPGDTYGLFPAEEQRSDYGLDYLKDSFGGSSIQRSPGDTYGLFPAKEQRPDYGLDYLKDSFDSYERPQLDFLQDVNDGFDEYQRESLNNRIRSLERKAECEEANRESFLKFSC